MAMMVMTQVMSVGQSRIILKFLKEFKVWMEMTR